jgi:hypothetical protein
MTNPYSPPESPVEDPPEAPTYTEQVKREKNATRPLGVVAIVVMFALFSVLGVAQLILESDLWAIIYAAISAMLAYWFRGLWWGDSRERTIAVFVGFLIAAATCIGLPSGSIQAWSVGELTGAAEGIYFFLSACYLAYIRNDPFFSAPKVP